MPQIISKCYAVAILVEFIVAVSKQGHNVVFLKARDQLLVHGLQELASVGRKEFNLYEVKITLKFLHQQTWWMCWTIIENK